ncbi:TPA: hypothetical protein EYP70_01605 [Candidatus Bathyarchaeota archaeon]|nr:hypothetical protein [Candidatus Bathyarchaeota archaeon]
MFRKVYVIFQFDVEDFLTPETDGILLKLAETMRELGVKASFCIVGEKARMIIKRKRLDVRDALKEQDIAYQSNYHSVHPVISEYLSTKSWRDGVLEIKYRESKGIEDLMKIFGVKPSAFIQPGGSWAPQTPYAMRQLGIPVYADGIFESDPYWFCGSICLKAAIFFPEHATKDDLEKLKSIFEKIFSLKKVYGGLITIVLHPCMFLTKKFWDALNFANGMNLKGSKIVRPELRSIPEVNESLDNFKEFVKFILTFDNVKVITFRDLPKIYSDEKRFLSFKQVVDIAYRATRKNDWQILNNFSLSPAEILRLLVDVIDKLKYNIKPECIPVKFTLGPTEKIASLKSKIVLSRREILKVCRAAKSFIDQTGRIPSEEKINKHRLGPADILKVSAEAVAFYGLNGSLPEEVEVEGSSQFPEVIKRWNLQKRIESQWRWVILPRNFRSKKIEELTLLQSWTIRPACIQDLT